MSKYGPGQIRQRDSQNDNVMTKNAKGEERQ